MPTLPKPFTATIGERALFAGRQASAADFDGGGGLAAGRAIQEGADRLLATREEQNARAAIVGVAQVEEEFAKAQDEAFLSGAEMGPLKERMADALSKIGENFDTKRGVDQLAISTANANRRFDQQANQISVQRASANAKVAGEGLMRDLSAAVIRDPTQLKAKEAVIDEFAATVPDVAAHLRPGIADGMKKNLNQASAWSELKARPAETKTALEGGAWDLTAEARMQLIAQATQGIGAQRAEDDRIREQAARDRKARNEAAHDDLGKRIMEGKGVRGEVMSNPDLTAATREHLIDRMKRWNVDVGEKAAKTVPSVFNAIRARIDLPQGTAGRLTDTQVLWSHYGKGLSKDDASSLEQRIQNNRSPEGQTWAQASSDAIQRLAPQLDKSTLIKMDNGGGERVLRFTEHLRLRAAAVKKAGGDEYDLLRPTSKLFIGQDIPMFQTGAQRKEAELATTLETALGSKEPGKRRSLDDIFKGPK